MNNDAIRKGRLNVILLVDASTSMRGTRIKQVDDAIADIKDYLINLQDESINVDFYLSILPFATTCDYYNNQPMEKIDTFDYQGIKVGGKSNLDTAYDKLEEMLKKESKGGIMPDFGGNAPIILLLTDGHPTTNKYKDTLARLQNVPWFKVALRYGIAIELEDNKTIKVLRDFVGNNGDVVRCYDASLLKNVIKIIVVTASKVKSSSTNISQVQSPNNSNMEIKQLISEELVDTEGWEW